MLPRLISLTCCLIFCISSMAKTIVVKNTEELSTANKEARPGDIIILRNGEWNNVALSLDCKGTKTNPILFKAQTAGKVLITGHSTLKLGGNFITVDGLYFINGYAGKDPVIAFCTDKNTVAGNCRVTHTVINDFNNPGRLEENYWIALYGKNNRLDHCSFLNKKNIGVLVAVMLNDERSRENNHSIDHNYFGVRLPLASNGGEIIRVGVSEYCEFNSSTVITDNFFEHCDGETEIISVKSCRNTVSNNLFKECQGAVVLRHGNFNTVANNVFLGNNKEGTGGVRVINKGQWVINNLFYKCRGAGFRSPLSIMNGVPNSPAYRYVAVTDAIVANNSFFDCAPISLCEGSDSERSAPPAGVQFLNNIFYNNHDSSIYINYDDISGIAFAGNIVSKQLKQNTAEGFYKTPLTVRKTGPASIPFAGIHSKCAVSDSIQKACQLRLSKILSPKPGYADAGTFLQIRTNAYKGCGAKWLINKNVSQKNRVQRTNCQTAEDIMAALIKNKEATLEINLTGTLYHFRTPVFITSDVVFTSAQKALVLFSAHFLNPYFLIAIKAGKSLTLKNLELDLSAVNTNAFISTDTSGNSNHSNLIMTGCMITRYQGTLFTAALSSISDHITISNCIFNNNKGELFSFETETGNKGYYNVEKLNINNNTITNHEGKLLTMLRSGKDESTMGPSLIFSGNKISNCYSGNNSTMIQLFGTQYSAIENNFFTHCNPGKILIEYQDAVRAVHHLSNNKIVSSGKVIENKFVESNTNTIQ